MTSDIVLTPPNHGVVYTIWRDINHGMFLNSKQMNLGGDLKKDVDVTFLYAAAHISDICVFVK